MKANYNGEILDLSAINIPFNDRGFRYGDGFFETIAVLRGHARLLERHYARITKGAAVFGFDVKELTMDHFTGFCTQIIRQNSAGAFAKIRFSIWRKGSGLYAPPGEEINFLLTFHPLQTLESIELQKVGFSDNTKNFPTVTSAFKTLSSIKYILAGVEKKHKSLEEIIINDYNGFVSETMDSNIFIKKDGVYITPPVATGCIDGVMRGWLIDALKSNQLPIEERFFIPNELLEADSAFTSNALGIKHIIKLGDAIYEKDSRIQKLVANIG